MMRTLHTNRLTPLAPSRSSSFLDAFTNRMVGTRGVQRLDTPEKWRGQCVSLVARYVQERFLPRGEQTRARSFGDGAQVAANLVRDFPQHFQAGDTQALPQPGAVISFSGRGPTGEFGHTAIVVDARGQGETAQVRVLESNQENLGEKSIVRVSGWVPLHQAEGVYGRALAWANPT